MKFVLAAVAAALLAASSASANVQGWEQTGVPPSIPGLPSQVHIHTEYPSMIGQTLTGPVTLPVTTLMHNEQPGKLTFVRWSCESTVEQSVTVNVPSDGSPVQKVLTNLTIDPSKCSAGWREIRVTSNFVTTGGRRYYTTTREAVQFRGPGSNYSWTGSPSDKGRCGGGSHYPEPGYLIVNVACQDVIDAQAGKPITQIHARSQTGKLIVALDPDFHAGNYGTTLLSGGNHGTWYTIPIPAGLAPGVHTLHLRDEYSNGSAGAYVLKFTV